MSASRRITTAIAGLVCIGCTSCTATHRLSPWLRVRASAPFTPFAESGQGGQRPRSERRTGRRWVAVEGDAAADFALTAGSRVVLGADLFTQDGPPTTLACPHTGRIGDGLRASPAGELMCIETSVEGAPASLQVRVTRFDDQGTVRARRTLVLPQSAGARDGATTDFVGFLGDELVVAVSPLDSVAPDAWHVVTAYALDGNDHARLLGTQRIQTDSWRIHWAGCWAGALGLPIAAGAYPVDAHGNPRWSACR